MNPLQSSQFPEFFLALHGYDPFPWQRRLAERVADGEWPKALSLPTASGKTACIDAAIFAMAVQATREHGERTAPRRILFVVDRRIVVDQAYERALKIADLLRKSSTGVLGQAAAALRKLGGLEADEDPLACFLLRGGIYRDQAWAKSPTQPTVIASTVDQVGSRLLFRGYGVSDSLRPIHAGLVGNDALIILDEAHCAVPFLQTTSAIEKYRRWGAPGATSPPFCFVVLSATPPPDLADDAPGLDQTDRDNPILKKRLEASKPTSLVRVAAAAGKSGMERYAKALVDEVAAVLVRDGQPRSVALMVNRVATARKCYELCRAKWRNDAAHVLLLTGRMRPIDRDDLLEKWRGLLASNENPKTLDRPLIVVATQCLEVGADWDFHALVTECASLDSLRQRFGRLDRLGVRTGAEGVILIREDQIHTESEIETAEREVLDRIYGASLHRTWNWLWTQADATASADRPVIDLGIDAVDAKLPRDPGEKTRLLSDLQLKAPNAPILLPAYIDCWVQTAPRPEPDPDVAPFLHGVEQGQPEVQVCWRADLTLPPAYLTDHDHALDVRQLKDRWIETVAICPPASPECMPVPIGAFRDWWSSRKTPKDDGSDLEQEAYVVEAVSQDQESLRPILRWLGPNNDETELILRLDDVHPGDTLVIPAALEGWYDLGHIPNADGDVAPQRIDLAERVGQLVRRKLLLRLHPSLMSAWPVSEPRRRLEAICLKNPDPAMAREELKDALRDLAAEETEAPEWFQEVKESAKALAQDRRFIIKKYPDVGLILEGSKRLPTKKRPFYDYDSDTETTEDDTSSATVRVTLDDHQKGVENLVKKYAELCVSEQGAQRTLALAGSVHDLGKLDPRFQIWLHGGNALAASLAPKPLAKSGGLPQSQGDRERARGKSGYPKGGRHEALSARLAEKLVAGLPGLDLELLLHLIASHHGHGRPFFPCVEDSEPVNVPACRDGNWVSAGSDTKLHRLDSGVPERFWSLVRRHGWWGLAWLEALLRLADHRQSALEQASEEAKNEP